MKKPLNVLSKTALAAVLAGTTIVPVMAVEAAETQSPIDKVLVENDGKFYSLSLDDYNEYYGDGISLPVNSIVTNNGETYSKEDFDEAYGETTDFEEAIKLLEEEEVFVPVDAKVSGTVEIENGKIVYKDENSEEEEETLKVESVSAINANLVQVTLSENAPSLNAENVKISNGVNVEKVTTAGNKVTIETSTLPANRDLTVTFDGVEKLDKASGTFKYNQAVNLETAIEGFVYVPKLNADGEIEKDGDENVLTPAIDVTVTAADGTTTKTDANGYYKLPAQVGTVEVTVEADGHYVDQDDVVVASKNSTAHVVELNMIDVDELKIEGTIKDDKTGKAVEGSTVTLQEKVDGKWKNIADVTVGSEGNYAFLNSEAEVSGDSPDEFAEAGAVEEFEDIFGERANKINHGKDYRVVAEKDVFEEDKIVVVDNTDDKPYHQATSEFQLNNKSDRTFEPVSMTAVKEIEKIETDFQYGAIFNGIENLGEDVTFSLIDTDGKTILAEVEKDDLGLKLDAETATHESNLDLVTEAFAEGEHMYLKSGTYYLKVDDGIEAAAAGQDENGTPGTAVQVLPIKITEGQDSTGTKVEAKKAENATVTSQFNYIPEDANLTGGELSADVKVYKTIDGVDVLVEEAFAGDNATVEDDLAIIAGGDDTTGQLKYTLDPTENKLTGELKLSRLAAEGYKVVVDDEYILGNPSTNVKLESGKTIQGNLAVDGGGVLAVTTHLVDNEKAALEAADLAKNIVYTDVTLTEKAGEKVEYKDIPLVFKKEDTEGKLNETETNKLLKEQGLNLKVSQSTDSGKEHELTFTFSKLEEGKYTADFSGAEFKDNSSKEEEVEMFQDTVTESGKEVELEMTPDIELAGSITFAGTKENAKVADIKVFDMNGETPSVVSDATLEEDNAGTYKVSLPKAQKGKYKVVFYGQKLDEEATADKKQHQFETLEKEFDLSKGENFEHVQVTKGGQGKIELNVFDSNGKRLGNDDVNITFSDAYTKLEDGTNFHNLSKDGNDMPFKDGYTESLVNLSKGDYKVLIKPANGKEDVYKSDVVDVTIDRINGTTLQTIEVPLVNNGKTFVVSGTISAPGASGLEAVEDAEVAIFDATTGEFVRNAKTDENGLFETKLSNGSYIAKTYVNKNFVAQKEIEVKDRKVDNVDMTTKKAER